MEVKELPKKIKLENPIKLIKREICRPPPMPPDRQNSLNHKHETKKESQEAKKIERELNYRPPQKLPYILDTIGEVMEIIENVVPKTRPPLKPPRIHGSIHREGIGQEKECLLNTVSNISPPQQSHHQKGL